MKTTIRRTICLALVIIMTFSVSTVAFAAEEIPESAVKVSNRYYFITVKGEERLLSTTTKTAAALAKESERKAWINTLAAIASAQYAGVGAAVSELVAQAHGYGTAAKINVYSRTDVKYKVDSVTGKRMPSITTYYIIYKLYVWDGSGYVLYKTRQCARHS